MPATGDDDGGEDVNDFLQRIKEMRESEDKEDTERNRKLEEKILQSRRERHERRVDRARSLSPTKTSSDAGSIPSRNQTPVQEDLSKTPYLPMPASPQTSAIDVAPRKLNIQAQSNLQDKVQSPPEHFQPPSRSQTSSQVSPSAAIPSRAGTLSWQQRPTSRGSTGGVRSRPLSAVASENNAAKSSRVSNEKIPIEEESKSRSQIAHSLESKDPTWFKQTPERGLGSAAFRRNQDDETPNPSSNQVTKQLPGMSREKTVDPEKNASAPTSSDRSTSHSREGSIKGNKGVAPALPDSTSLSSATSVGSPLPIMGSQRFEPPSDKSSSQGDDAPSTGRVLAMSPSQGRLSPERMERPASPTKGLGGFVQSAMLKRSDSVNKRWSAQAGPGLSRGNSIASNTSRYPIGGPTPIRESRPNSMSREVSPVPIARPSSSHSNTTITQGSADKSKPVASKPSSGIDAESSPKGNGCAISIKTGEARSPPPLTKPSGTTEQPLMSPPASPSKRWSPTKSSWLENALNKPESPKILSPASQQPAWMSEMNKAKNQRGNSDLSKGVNFKEVATGGLIRSPALGSSHKSPTFGGLSNGFSGGEVSNSRRAGSDANKPKEAPPDTTEDSDKAQETSPPAPLISPPVAKRDTQSGKEAKPEKSSSISKSQSSSPRPAPPIKSKPETPPKTDFKSNLKPRQTSGESKGKDEPEFRNVFGKLKRTQPQNYVPPNELKDNILRGKAGLSMTGGPKKSERKDELKDSILQKKKGMIAPSASTRITSASAKNPDASIPEAIAKRQGLTRSGSSFSRNTETPAESSKPEALAESRNPQDKPMPKDKPRSSPPEEQAKPNAFVGLQKTAVATPDLGGNFASSLASIIQRGPSPMTGSANQPATTAANESASLPTTKNMDDKADKSGPQLTHATKSRAKGPKRRLPTTSKNEAAVNEAPKHAESRPKPISIENNPARAHETTEPQSSPLSPRKAEPRPLSNITNNNNNNRMISQPSSPRKPSTSIATPQKISDSPAPTPKGETAPKPSPVTKQQPSATPVTNEIKEAILPSPQSRPDASVKPARTPEISRPEFERRLPQQTEKMEEAESPLPSVKGAAATWMQTPKSSQSNQPRSPVKLPTRQDEEAAMEQAGLRSKESTIIKQPTPIKISTSTPVPQKPVDRGLSSSKNSPKSPPLPGKPSASVASRVSLSTVASPTRYQRVSTPLSKPDNASEILADVFDNVSTSVTNIVIDTQSALNGRSMSDSSQKIKTLRKQIFEILENGRSVPVPSHQEHILFEDSLYLCTHVFGNPAGQRTTEVYLWCGDGVSPSAVDDAHLFAKKTAKDQAGKLIILHQGKETSNFFQALGGIVITRRGSSSHADSTGSAATYMLCGRQHVGQIAFDEVDFSSRSLCQGFPYIVSARFGKLFLWKGRGAGADELGCARLIGMDLGLTGEIEEIDDGNEPEDFWSSFPSGGPETANGTAVNGQHWHLKPSCERYTTRLLSVDVELPRPKSSSSFMQWGRRGSAPPYDANAPATAQVREITPFSQADLVDDEIFVLDAFFEIFVIVPLRSLNPAPQHRSTKLASFRAALLFAQEYGILAASAEDRPFVPQSYVVLAGKDRRGGSQIPEGIKRSFRKWHDSIGEGTCKILQLTAALEAMGASRGP